MDKGFEKFVSLKFPNDVNNSDTMYFQPVATRRDDLRIMIGFNL